MHTCHLQTHSFFFMVSFVKIGDYLGEKDQFCVEVMHAYIDLVDFKGAIDRKSSMAFLDALRLFLGCFRIPGESQKIDRMMLKFAQR